MSGVGHVVRQMIVKLNPDGDTPVAYECAVTSVKETPNRSVVTTQTACPDGTLQDVGPTSWSVDITYNTSFLPGSLHRLLLDNDGAVGDLEWEPDPINEPGTKRTATVVLTAGGVDSTVGNYATAQVSLPVQGTITTVDPTP